MSLDESAEYWWEKSDLKQGLKQWFKVQWNSVIRQEVREMACWNAWLIYAKSDL